MSGVIEVIDGGIGNSIQDAGRFGFRHIGVAVSGSLDTLLARCANALVGNGPDCACIEIRALGPTLEVRHGLVRVALAGDVGALLRRVGGAALDVPAWTSITLATQDVLEIGSLPGGTANLAVSGGIDSPLQLGSRSTYQRAMIGGIDGRPLVTGNLLPCSVHARRDYREYRAEPWSHGDGPIRVIRGPQAEHFQAESLELFLNSAYQVTPQIDRMGVRLQGPQLLHVTPEAADIVSDGVTPGTIQVPGDGQPIILLADCQTVGGYPKIATVIAADVPRLAHLQPGQNIRFCAVNAHQARQALLEREARWAAWARGITFALPNADALYNDPSSGWVCAD
ncbi:MAG: biotin-dependent carboxyltransferase [Propionivibrio sp.]|uniref:Biotin-dependent carboxyltransferase n=1 Tax=Candidatus Propionivibrio dominans TaxID=2954373 RepID=A0A9D7IE54_9RHOO|nr:biotin-dependent carboxyltransferase [Candidatus Propionivibrio dominans]